MQAVKRLLAAVAVVLALFGAQLGCGGPQEEDPGVEASATAQAALNTGSGTDVMLQGFVWGTQSGWYTTMANNASAIQGAGFTMVWFPPPSLSGDVHGYLPTQWNNLSSGYGTQAQLQAAVTAMHNVGVKAIADIVINHRNGTANWADFTNPSFSNNNKAICSGDEYFQSGNPGAGQTGGNADTGEPYAAARDLDHTNVEVQNGVKAYLGMLKSTVGFDGWRYDYVKGYAGSYVGMYNDATSPYFSVGENWPTNAFDVNNAGDWRGKIDAWIAATGYKSAAFDFVTKPLLAQALQYNDFGKLNNGGKPAGVLGDNPAYAVTFLDNHDTGPATGGQNMWPFPSANVEQGYAYILTHPGVPSVFWSHYFDWGTALQTAIKNMIALRKAQGITSTSAVSIQQADGNLYAAIVNGNTAVKIGPGSWSPSGTWTLALSGTNYAIWKSGGGTPPSPPTGLTATPVSSSQINLSWTASSGATSYTVYRATGSGGTYGAIGTQAGTTLSATGLAASTTYCFEVSAANGAGASAVTSPVCATTLPASGYTSNFATMFLRGTMSATTWDTSLPMSLVAHYTWRVTVQLAASTTYQFKFDTGSWASGQNWGAGGTAGVAAVNSSTNLTYTSGVAGAYTFTFNDSTLAWSVTPPTPTVPAAPSNVTAAAAAGQITVAWAASSGATSYTVYRAATSAGPFTTSVGTTATTSFVNGGLTAGATWYYQVAATNAAGTSPNSATVSATVPAGYASNFSKMYLRGTLSATAWDTSIPMTLVANYTWRATVTLAASTAYQFKFDTGSWTSGQNWGAGSTAGVAAVNASTNLSYTSGVAGTYTFTFNDSTLAYTVTAPAPTIPAAPTGVAAVAASSSQITVSWTASAGATSYTVYRATSSTGTYASVGTATGTSFANTGLAAGTTYYYQVTASNVAGTSARSATVSATTPLVCGTVSVTFTVANANTVSGQYLYVVGNQTALGNWTPASGFRLAIQGTGANATWSGTVQLPAATAIQYKYVKYNPSTGAATWESNQATTSGNREKTTAACGSSSSFADGNFKF